MPEAFLAPGAHIECRSAEWLVRSLGRSSDGQQVVDVVGVSSFVRVLLEGFRDSPNRRMAQTHPSRRSH